MRLARPLAWAIAAVTVVSCAIGAGLAFSTPAGPSTGPTSALWPVPFAAMAAIGAFVAIRRPRNATGWLFLASGSLMVVNALAQDYANYAIFGRVPLPSVGFIAWLGNWTWMPAAGLIALILVVFPSGSPPSRNWRWPTYVIVALSVAPAVAALPTLGAPARSLLGGPSGNTIPGGGMLNLINVVLPFVLPIGFLALGVRFWRSRGIERLQMKWFVFGSSLLPVATMTMIFVGGEDPISTPLGWASVMLAMTAIPVTSGIAILRYRLYDIDRIISRTVAYAVVTAVLASVYALVALAPMAIVGRAGDTPDALIAGATLVVAAAFVPVRRRVQSAVDRRFNRARYDAARTIEAFSARLRDEVDLDALGAELEDIVVRTMQPSHVSLWRP